MNENKEKIIKIKHDIDWHIILYLLQIIYGFPKIMNNEEFREKFDPLYKFVSSKVNTPYKGNIIKEYAVIEQEATDDDYEMWLKNNEN